MKRLFSLILIATAIAIGVYQQTVVLILGRLGVPDYTADWTVFIISLITGLFGLIWFFLTFGRKSRRRHNWSHSSLNNMGYYKMGKAMRIREEKKKASRLPKWLNLKRLKPKASEAISGS